MLILFLSCFFFACKRSNTKLKRDFDPKLIKTLNKLAHQYADKKVRINTWNKNMDAYQDIEILNDNELPTKQTLTIGDSVQFISIDLNHTDVILAKIKYKNKNVGYVPYSYVEEFEPATAIDPDLRD